MDVEIRQPDAEFVLWLKNFDPELRCRWNPQLKRWVIDERNRETRQFQCILVWQTDKGDELPLSRDLCVRLELMRAKYKQMLIVSPSQYLRELQDKADRQWAESQAHAGMERRGLIAEDINLWRKAANNARAGQT